MKISPHGIATIASYEGLRLTAYQDVADVWTIGYGHTLGVQEGDTITHAEADAMLANDVGERAREVSAAIKVPVTQNQFDACVCLAYNIGVGAFKGSTLLRLLNSGDYVGAALQFPRWDKAGGVSVAGLTKRRLGEQMMFLTPDAVVAT